MATSL